MRRMDKEEREKGGWEEPQEEKGKWKLVGVAVRR